VDVSRFDITTPRTLAADVSTNEDPARRASRSPLHRPSPRSTTIPQAERALLDELRSWSGARQEGHAG